MNKHYLSLLALATLLCMMLFGASSCKKDDPDGGETPDPTEADFFIEANYLSKEKANGELAPRLLVNYNDEIVMVELWPTDNAPLETILILAPDHQTVMLCGDQNMLICAAYDLQTDTPSDEVLLVTPLDDNNLLLTKCLMDWNTHTLTKGDKMVLPVGGGSKSRGDGDDQDSENREFTFNHLAKPIAEYSDKIADICPGPFGSALSAFGNFIAVGLTINLYDDKPLELLEHSEYFVTKTAEGKVQSGILEYVPLSLREAASLILKAYNWSNDGGHGKVDDYEGQTGGEDFPYANAMTRSSILYNESYQPGEPPALYHLTLNVTNVTETTANFKGSFQFGGNSITPVEMGYVFKVSGGPEFIVEDMNFQGKTISGLQKATKYTAYAYAETFMGDREISPSVTFWTLGFEAFPSSLTFPAEGDTKYVGLSYSHEDITSWDITSKPSWCSTNIDDLGLLAVTVGESTETRSGTITITAHSNALGNLTQDIAVTQGGANGWDGTSWDFRGLLTTNYSWGYSSTYETGIYLYFNGISNDSNVCIYPSSFTLYNEKYIIDENGSLVYTAASEYTENSGYSIHKDYQITFVRTGPTTATADYHSQSSDSNLGIYEIDSGLFQGTLNNAKEIKDYKSTRNSSEGFLWPFPIGQ